MKRVLELSIEDYIVIVNEESRIATYSNQTIEENGLTWSVWLNGVVVVFSTIVYNSNVYNEKHVAKNGICWIANKEKTPKQRFAKYDELIQKYLQ